MAEWAGSKVEELSKGMQQKVQFIAAVLHEPGFMILDEPFSGLDPASSVVLKDALLDLKKQGKTILSQHASHGYRRAAVRLHLPGEPAGAACCWAICAR